VHACCAVTNTFVPHWKDFRAKWLRSQGGKWGGVNMQLPEDGWKWF
jgi:hypothetical protein